LSLLPLLQAASFIPLPLRYSVAFITLATFTTLPFTTFQFHSFQPLSATHSNSLSSFHFTSLAVFSCLGICHCLASLYVVGYRQITTYGWATLPNPQATSTPLQLLIPFSQALALNPCCCYWYAFFFTVVVYPCLCYKKWYNCLFIFLKKKRNRIFFYCPAIGKIMPSLVGKVCTTLRFVCLTVFAKKSSPVLSLP
jgi:hypothetical protein